MELKSKFDYEVEAFEKAFADKKDKRIALYGTGRMTATLLERLKGFDIVGVLDKSVDLVGSYVFGKEVLDQKKAETVADIIVINTSGAYWETIYQRIADYKIPIYYRNGELACKKAMDFESNEYWQKNADDLRAKISESDVVSFDVFDTLIVRRVSDNMDVFRIVEGKLRSKYGDLNYAQIRKQAASVKANPTLDEIYDAIKDLSGWSDEFINCAKQEEIDTEKALITARTVVADLYREATKSKDVYLVSDMYFPKEIIYDFLTTVGVPADINHIIVSCDYKKNKQDGSLWEFYSKEIMKGRKALHIGDDVNGDVVMPARFGIKTYEVWSAAKLAENSYLRGITAFANSPFESILCSLLTNKICNDPFCFHKSKGKIVFSNEREAGYVLLGAIGYVFCAWLLEQAVKDNVAQLLFLARDGYLLKKLFSAYCDLVGAKDAPELVYLETSRRAVLTASIRTKDDIAEVADFPYNGTRKDFFYDRFGIEVSDAEKEPLFYADEILKEAERERKNYLRYLETLNIKDDCAVIDTMLYGTVQYYLGKVLRRNFLGYYLCVRLDSANRYLVSNKMKGCFCGEHGEQSNICKNNVFSDSFFTAPNGMMECVCDDGTIKYKLNGKSQENFAVREDMLDGIIDFMKDVEAVRKASGVSYTDSSRWADKAFGILMKGAFEPTAKMKKAFYYDNGIAGRMESAIFE